MLTSDLVRATVRGRDLRPTLVDPERADLLDAAELLVGLAAEAAEEGRTWGSLSDAMADEAAAARAPKVVHGLAKLVGERCDVATEAAVPPAELRARVFRAARDAGPLALAPDALGRLVADDVLAAVGAEVGLAPEAVREALYADLPEAQRVRGFRALTAKALLHRYNVALVQALLLRAFEVRIRLEQPTVDRVRQLLRHARFHQLLFHATREGTALHLVLDGPTSLFERSVRYGLQLARFFPAVLLQPGDWTLEAEVAWTRAQVRKHLRVTPADGLVTDRADTGAWVPRERTWFLERWHARASHGGWRLTDDTLPLDLGGYGVVLPDLTFTDGRRVGHLEIVGTWRRAWLERRVDALRRHGPGNVVLAVSRRLAASKADALDGLPVIPFGEIVPVDEVLAALERVGR